MPCVGVAFSDVKLFCLAVVDGQVQGLNAFATLGGSGFKGIRAAFRVRCVMPSVSVALGDGEVLRLAVVDSEVKGRVDLAALRCDIVVLVCAALRIGFTIPIVLVAFCNSNGRDILAVVNS